MQRECGVAAFGSWRMLVLIAAALAPAAAARGASPATERQTQEEAIRSIPFQELTAETRAKLERVLGSPSIYRRLPPKTVGCDPDLYRFLIRNPEVVVNIWQLMGFSNYTAERLGPYLWKGKDGTGRQGECYLRPDCPAGPALVNNNTASLHSAGRRNVTAAR